jgi:uncharacterized membrane protein
MVFSWWRHKMPSRTSSCRWRISIRSVMPGMLRRNSLVRSGPSAIRLFAAKLGLVMPFWYGLCLLLLLTETFVMRHQAHALTLGVASAIWAMVITLTILFLVPINNRLARFENPVAAEKALREHRKWDTLHRLRVLALTTAMVMFLAAVSH